MPKVAWPLAQHATHRHDVTFIRLERAVVLATVNQAAQTIADEAIDRAVDVRRRAAERRGNPAGFHPSSARSTIEQRVR